MVTSDGVAPAVTDRVLLTVTALNDAPATVVPVSASVVEDVPLVFSAAGGNGLSVSDVDSSAMRAMTLKASSGFSPLIGRFVRGQCLAARRHEGVERGIDHAGIVGEKRLGGRRAVGGHAAPIANMRDVANGPVRR